MDVTSLIHIFAILTSSVIVILGTSVLHSITRSELPRRKVINNFWLLMFVVVIGFFNNENYMGWASWYSKLELQKALNLLTVLFFVSLTSSALDYFIYDGVYKRKHQHGAPRILTNILKVIIYFVALCFAMQSIYGVDIQTILASAGIGGMILGFSAQNTLSNLFAGIAIQFGGKLKMGDWVEGGDFSGAIHEFSWRSVTLKAMKTSVIPNSKIASSTIKVYTPGEPFYESVLLTFSMKNNIQVIKSALHSITNKCCPGGDGSVSIMDYPENNIVMRISSQFHNRTEFFSTKAHIITGILSESIKQGFSLSSSLHLDHDCIQDRPEKPPQPWVESMFNMSEVFAKLPNKLCMHILDESKTDFFLDNEVIYRQDQEGDFLYFVVSGTASSYEIHDHVNVKMRDFKPGDFFGLKSFTRGGGRRTTVIATSFLWCVCISRKEFSQALKSSTSFMDHLVDLLSVRQQQNTDLHEKISKKEVKAIRENIVQRFLGSIDNK